MTTNVRVQVRIQRPRHDVAAFMFDPRNDIAWTSGVVSVHALSPGALTAGSKVERTARFLGREFAYVYEVVDFETDRFVEMRVEQPFPMRIRYELQDAPDGTFVTIHTRGDASGFYRLAAPLLNAMVRRSLVKDLGLLRRCLEGEPSANDSP